MDHDRHPGPDPAGSAVPAPPSGDDGSQPPRRANRRISRRALAISVCVATIGALIAALVTLEILEGDESPETAQATLETLPAPDTDRLVSTALETIDGQPTTLAAHLDHRPMVLNIWAQSCVPCVDEMPLLEAAHQANPDIAFLGVDTQDRLEKAKALAEQTGITYPWVQDPSGNFFFEARASGMPTTLLLDRRGRIVATRTGAFRDQADLQGWIDRYRPDA